MVSAVSQIAFILKSLFYQGNFNTDNMQGTGFAWLVKPELDKLGIRLPPEENKKLNSYFNTNPSFISLIIGIFLNELKHKRTAFATKNIYGAAFAALGDSFFWHGLKPLLFMVTLFVYIDISPWGILIYPIIYSSFHLLFLGLGKKIGELLGGTTITIFNRVRFSHWADFADKASVFMLGVLIVQFIKLVHVSARVTAISAVLFILGMLAFKFVRLTILLWLLVVIAVAALVFHGGNIL